MIYRKELVLWKACDEETSCACGVKQGFLFDGSYSKAIHGTTRFFKVVPVLDVEMSVGTHATLRVARFEYERITRFQSYQC